MKTFIDDFLRYSHDAPDRPAVSDRTGTYTYSQLAARSYRLARLILDKCRDAGQDVEALRRSGKNGARIALLLPRTRDCVTALIAVVRAGCCAVPIDAGYPAERVRSILNDSGSDLCVTVSEFSGKAADVPLILLDDITYTDTDDEPELDLSSPEIEGLLVFTSGSTGKPKGVLHSQRAFFSCSDALRSFRSPADDERTLCMSGFGFVVSMFDIITPLISGGCVYIADEKERRDIVLLHDVMLKNNITGMYMPAQMFAVMRELYGKLPLRYVVVAGEKLTAPCTADENVIEIYGTSESFMVLGHRAGETDAQGLLGKPLPEVGAYLIGEAGNRITAPGVIGELCVLSPYLASGYIGMPDETSAKFVPCPFEPGRMMYRTGDYMEYDGDGNYIFHGRRDRMVKLRGYRVELGEIEQVMKNAGGIKETACVMRNVSGGDKLCCYYAGHEADVSALTAHASLYLPEYMVPDYFVHLGVLPRNDRGKIDYPALDAIAPPAAEGEYIAPVTGTEKRVCAAFAAALGMDGVGVTEDFFDAGGTSVSAAVLVAKLKDLRAGLSFMDVMNNPTPRGLSAYIDAAPLQTEMPEKDREYYPLTKTQMGIYLEAATGGSDPTYTIPYLMQAAPGISADEIIGAVKAVAAAHPSMKYIIRVGDDGIPHMVMTPDADIDIPVFDGKSEERISFMRRFMPVVPMTDGLLFHFAVYRTAGCCYLALKSHLIFLDATSISLIIEELDRALSGQPLHGEECTVQQTATDEERLMLDGTHDAAKRYYEELFGDMDDIPALEGDIDGTPTPGVSENMRFRPAGLTVGRVKAFCASLHITESSFFMGAMALLLGKYLNTRRVSFSAVFNGRTSSEMSGTIGTLIRRIPVYGNLSESITVREFLGAMSRQIFANMSSSIFSFDEVLKAFPVNDDVEFIYQGDLFTDNMGAGAGNALIEGDKRFIENYHTGMVTGCMSIQLFASAGEYSMTIEYRNEKFSREWIGKFAENFFTAAEGLMTNERISGISLLSTSDRDTLAGFNDTFEDIGFTPVHEQIRQWARKTPDAPAVTAGGRTLTFGELDELSDRAAAALARMGAARDVMVGVLFDREVRAYAAEIAVLKAGGAFVPFISDHPDKRIDFCMKDGNIPLLLTTEKIRAERPGLGDGYVVVTFEQLLSAGGHDTLPVTAAAVQSHDLAYCIYTSGTTGRPKGVMIEHGNIANYVFRTPKSVEIMHYAQPGRVCLALASFSFDVSVVEEFVPLCNGNRVVIASEEEIRTPALLAELITDNGVNGITCTPTYLLNLLDIPESLDALRRITFFDIGAEAFPARLYDRLRALRDDSVILNVYGPTEATMGCSAEVVTGGGMIPAGAPILNTRFYIADTFGNELPPGIKGELVICGAQVGRGYIGLPEKTAESFFTHDGMRAYRSGDLAMWTGDGKIRIFGRLDDQIKLHGLRIEPGEIEARASLYPGIKQAAAAVRGERLVLYYTTEENAAADTAKLRGFLAETLAEYMVPTVYMMLSDMPLTQSGKLDRKALPEPVNEQAAEYVAPRNEAEQAVADCMKRALERDADIGAPDNFFDIGGDSIKAIRMVSFLRERGIIVKPGDVMKHRTVESIALCVKYSSEEPEISQEPIVGMIEDSSIFLLFKDLGLPDSICYVQSTLLEWKGRADPAALQTALDGITYQHDMLRACFRDGHLFVKPAVSGKHAVTIEEYALDDDTDKIKALCEDIQSHLDADAALVRAALIHAGERYLFFVTAHHTVVDGISWRIILEDLETAYGQALSGEPVKLPKKTHTYRDYALAMKAYRDSFTLSREIPYWQETSKKLLAMDISHIKDFSRHFRQLDVSMDRAETEKMLAAKLSAYRLEINDLLVSAVARSYRETFGKDSMSIMLEGHGREYLGRNLITDRTVGWFTSNYPIVLENLNGDAQHDLIRVKETLRRVPNKGVGYNILAFVQGETQLGFEKNRSSGLLFNYLGDVSGGEDNKKYFAPDSKDGFSAGLDYTSDRNNEGPDLAVNCLVEDGCFRLYLNYNSDMYDENTALSFARGILKETGVLADHLKNVREPVVTASDLGETVWNEEVFGAVTAEFAERGEHIRRIYPLIPMQERMLLSHIMDPESSAYRLVDIYELDFLPAENELRTALDALARKHEVLRTAIIHEGVPVYRQAITDRMPGLAMTDISGESDKLAAVYAIRGELLRSAFDLQKKPLFGIVCAKTSDSSCYILTAVHHIIIDGWCIGKCFAEFEKFLQMARKGAVIPEVSSKRDGLYESAVRELVSKDRRAAARYFAGLLEGYENRAEIPAYGTIPEGERCDDGQIVRTLDSGLVGRFGNMCRSAGVTLSNGMELAWGLVIQTACRMDDVVFAEVVSGRDGLSADVSDIVGLFINSVPVRVRTDRNATAAGLLNDLREQAAERKEFEHCSPADIQKAAGVTGGMIYSVFSFENYGDNEDALTVMRPVLIKEEHLGTTDLDATVRADGSIEAVISFDPARYRGEEMQRLFALLENFMACMAEHPDVPVSSFPLMNAEDEAKIVALSRGETYVYDTSVTWVDLFLKCAREMPDNIAVADSTGSYTYAELDRASDSIAAWLTENGAADGGFAALCMGRVKEFLAAAIGVHKAGAAYVPLDPEYPQDRIAYMLEDSGACAVMTEETVARALEKYPGSKPINRAVPEGHAYMIYTSGSTGKPKGVVIQHKAMLNFVHFIRERWHLTEKSRISCHSTFSFDASVEDLYPALTAGGCVFIVPEEARRDVTEMKRYLKEKKINGGSYTTLFGQLLGAGEELDVDYIVLGGETMTSGVNARGRVYNAYGPTEFTVDATYFELEKGKTYDPIPIGRALYNSWAFVCAPNGALVPAGIAGELCLAGEQTAEGYWERPELTAEKFVECPFLKGRKMYRTGDLVRYNEDGELEYLGRIDDQVKLRGYRIEPGEIENRADSYAGVMQAAAEVRKDRLVLYYTQERGSAVDKEKLRQFLAETLADYMVPTVYMPLAAMPMTPSGKINRKALPEPDISALLTEYEAPESDTEKQLCELFEKVLELAPGSVGRNDDLFILGGNSIAAMTIMTVSGIEGLSTKMIFMHRTPKRIAEALSAYRRTEDLRAYEAAARSRSVPATDGQISMIDYQFLNPYSVMYNLSVCYRFDRSFDAQRLAAAADRAVRQHPALYTVFDFDEDGRIVQQMKPGITGRTKVEDITPEELKKLSGKLIYPFEFFHKPLFRARVFRCGEDTVLFMDMHHAITDGTSADILMEDILRAYRGERPEQDYYYTYILKEYENRSTKEYEEAKRYFGSLLADKDWCNIPTPDHESWEADAGEEYREGAVSVSQVKDAEKRLGCSRNVLAIAAAMLALREYCGRDEVRVDHLNSDRTDTYLQHTVGLLFKSLPVAADLKEFATIGEFLNEVSDQVIEGSAHSICDYSSLNNVALDDAVEVNYIGTMGEVSDMSGITPVELDAEYRNKASGTHVEIYLMEENGQVNVLIEYQKSAYDDGSMKKYMDIYVRIFRQLMNISGDEEMRSEELVLQ